MPRTSSEAYRAMAGCLVGTAVGDALGLPYEGLSRRRQQRLFKSLTGHRLLWKRGMCSDDTEHTCMVASALIDSAGNSATFARSLAWRFRFWLLGFPAGVGLATLRAIGKLWLGFPVSRSGVYSAGNGPAMRSAIIGAAYGHDRVRMLELVKVSSRLTHSDPRAELGAIAVALAASMSARTESVVSPEKYLEEFRRCLSADDISDIFSLAELAVLSCRRFETTQAFAGSIGLQDGVSGFVLHTVPIVLHAWLSYPDDYVSGVKAVIACGGDTDTTAAIVGGIIGARTGIEGIPPDWRTNLIEWPRNILFMTGLARRLAGETEPDKPVLRLLFVPAVLIRNCFFLVVILLHGFRRLLPPY